MRNSRTLVAAAMSMALVVSACGAKATPAPNGSGTSPGSGGPIAQLTFPAEADESAGNLVNYNPYAPKPLTSNWTFESLMIQNGITCEITPWLATEYKWDAATKLTFTIRDGVKWSDGQPFTANDVAFTFNLGKQYPAIDQGGVWTETFGAPAKTVTATGNQVVMEFSGNAASKFPKIITAKILPEHVYGKVGDPTKYVDKEPVSTGPFKIGNYNGRRLELVRRDDYWQADKVKVQKLVLEGHYEASQAALKLSAGELDLYYGEIPNPEKTFVAKDPGKNHYWYAPNGSTVLTSNVTKPPFNDPKFREAMSYAMNKEEMSLKATYSVMKPASQSGLKLPAMVKMLPDKYAAGDGASTVLPYDTAKAEQMLDAAGYPKGGDGFRTNKDGSPLAITFQVQSGFIDYQAMADVVVKGLNAVGISAKVNASSPDAVDQLKKSGEFQMLFEYLHGGCDFANGLGAKLASSQIPKPNSILPNVERFTDPATDETITALAGTTDDAERRTLVGKLVDTMMTQFPVTTLIYAPARIIYRSDKAVGWPTPENPYAHPDDRLLILTHLSAP
jgi:peptide/nickel transport system substrate-binding protein